MLLEHIIHIVSVWQKQSAFAFRNCWTVGNCVLFSSRMCWDSTDPFQTKTTRRNNKVIRYSNMHYGQVEHFIIVETQCPPRYAGSFSKYLLFAIVNVIIIVAGMADVTRSTSHMHMVPLQSPTGKLAVVPWQDKCDVCVSANVHEDLHIVSVLPSRIKKVGHHALACHARQPMWKFYFWCFKLFIYYRNKCRPSSY